MIQCQKQLDGLAVVDAEKIIQDFKLNPIFNPAKDENDYNIVGQVPLVNQKLAQKYVEMRDAMRKRKELQEAQQRSDTRTTN